jgi:hypothetical protein
MEGNRKNRFIFIFALHVRGLIFIETVLKFQGLREEIPSHLQPVS